MATTYKLRDPHEIEARRLLAELESAAVGRRLSAATARMGHVDSDSPEWDELREQTSQLTVQFQEQQELISQYHWVLGRDVVTDVPPSEQLAGGRVLALLCGPVACVWANNEEARYYNQFDFSDYDRFTVSASGWLTGHGMYDNLGGNFTAKPFRHKLLQVPFRKFEVLLKMRSYVTLKLLD